MPTAITALARNFTIIELLPSYWMPATLSGEATRMQPKALVSWSYSPIARAKRVTASRSVAASEVVKHRRIELRWPPATANASPGT